MVVTFGLFSNVNLSLLSFCLCNVEAEIDKLLWEFFFQTDLFVPFFPKDIATGKSVLFAPRLPAEYAVWLGEIKPLSYFKVIVSFNTFLCQRKKQSLLVSSHLCCSFAGKIYG